MLYSILRIFTLSAALLCAACAASPDEIAHMRAVTELNVKGNLALQGYDAVAYFTQQTPTPGDPAFSYTWNGAQWQFTSEDHLNTFKHDPMRYAPQFGGYCAYAVSIGKTADGDPKQWAIVDDKLYLNNNALAMTLWNRDRPGNIRAGDVNWPLIPKHPIKDSK